MTDLDLDRLGDLWRKRPTPAEMEALRRSAEVVRRRARWGQIADSAAAIVVAGFVLILVLANPTVNTMLVGGGAILILLISQARSRKLRAEELRALTGSTEEMLDQSVARARATLKRIKFQLLAIVPGFLFGVGITALADRSSGELYARLTSEPELGLWLAGGAVLLLGAVALYFTKSVRATRQELDRLVALQDSFRAAGTGSADEEPGPGTI